MTDQVITSAEQGLLNADVLGLETRDKHSHCVVCQGNAEALTTIAFQGRGKKMLVYQFHLLMYVTLYLLSTADNDYLIFSV